MSIDDLLATATGFDWDEGNETKNWAKHQVSKAECEQVFFNLPLVVQPAQEHLQRESRFYGLGQTDDDRLLFVVFTMRSDLVRVISARPMSRRERRIYSAS